MVPKRLPAQKKPDAKSSWIVKMKCEAEKEVIVDGCSEKEAWANPWDYAIGERELSQWDWEVVSVEENK